MAESGRNKTAASNDIAVIGMACRFPGAQDLAQFWDNLVRGEVSIGEIPAERWDWRTYWGDPQQQPNRCNSRWGGFIGGVDAFDREFFGLSTREVEAMDPQQRLALELAWTCIEDAGIAPSRLAGANVGVFTGIANLDYKELVEERIEEVDAYYATGVAASVLANRISFLFNLRGPSMSVDTACSSSLYALHLACQALLRGDCELAIAGGVSLLLTPRRFLGFAKARMLSPSGAVRTFDDAADGMLRGEGGGLLLLKPLAQAEASGDRILGVIAGSAINHSGKTRSLTYPDSLAQAEVIRAAQAAAGVGAADLSYIEAHGTGTPKGDPIELDGLMQVFAARDGAAPVCHVGSVKPNIGHLEAAAGIAGLAKVLLALQHRQLPPLPHFRQLNSRVDAQRLAASGLRMVERSADWPSRSDAEGRPLPRIAGVSAFGFAGTNAHVVVREAPPRPVPAPAPAREIEVLCLSAKTDAALAQKRADLLAWLERHGQEYALSDICAAALRQREHFSQRQALLAGDLAQLKAALRQPAVELPQDVAPDTPLAAAVALARAYLEDAAPAHAWSGTQPVRHVPLPGYPFAATRCWLPGTAALPADAMPALFYQEAWAAMPLPAATAPQGKVVCFSAGRAQAEAWERAARAQGLSLHGVWPGSPAQALESGQRQVDFDDVAALTRLLDALGGAEDAPLTLWYCAQLETPRTDTSGAAAFAGVLRLLQAAAASKAKLGRLVLAVPASASSLSDAWRGLRFALERARPALAVHVVQAGPQAGIEDWLGWLMREENAAPGVARYAEGRRLASVLAPQAPQPSARPVALRHGGCYLITGGMGGLGQRFAMYLAASYRARVVLVGRSRVDAALTAALARLQLACGGELRYRSADVADRAQLQAVLDETRADWGQLHGVIHAAGVADQRCLTEKSLEEIERILRPKIDGAQALDALLGGQALDFICHFSSLAAVAGDFGAAAYALGNRYLLAHAGHALAAPGRPKVLTLAWPLWREGAMGFASDAERDRYLAATGQRMLETKEGFALFERALGQEANAAVIIAGDVARVNHWLGARGLLAAEGAQPEEAGQPAPVEAAAVRADAALAPARATMPAPDTLGAFLGELLVHAGRVVKVAPEQLGGDSVLADCGFDSIALMDLAQALGTWLHSAIQPGVFFNYPTFGALAAQLLSQHGAAWVAARGAAAPTSAAVSGQTETPAAAAMADTPPAAINDADEQAIAIIGYSGRFPGARDAAAFWRQLRDGDSAVAAATRPWLARSGQRRWLAGVDGLDEFDPQFFDISALEAERMDPRERLLLQEAWHALEDAGCGAEALRRHSIGMFVGAEACEYGAQSADAGSIISGHNGILAARLSYFLDLKGPNISLNTACSSGLVALHQACLSLRAGECGMALAAAVNLMLSPRLYVKMERAGMLAPDGLCRAFDEQAEGIVPGEAVVALVLKPLRQAQRDGDTVHAVIRASGLNYDGRTNGITAPSGLAQAELIAATYRRHAIDAARIAYVVTHGTGTRLGDPVELNALDSAFQQLTERRAFCALTSNKPNSGHTFAVSGLVSVVNLIESMRHDLIPASLNWTRGNAYADWAGSAFFVNQAPRPWPAGQDKWGAVSAFGMSGTNAHVVLQQGPRTPAGAGAGPVLLTVAAKTPAALREMLAKLAEALEQPGWRDADLPDVAHTLLRGRMHFACRQAVVAATLGEAAARLRDAAAAPPATPRPPAFLDGYLDYLGGQYRQAAQGGGAAQTTQLLAALGQAYTEGAPAERLPLPAGRIVRLPGYAFARVRYWRDDAVENGPAATALQALPAASLAAPDSAGFVLHLDGDEAFLRDHVLAGRRILPASAMLELARAAFEAAQPGGDGAIVLRDVSWSAPLAAAGPCQVQLLLAPGQQGMRYRLLGAQGLLHSSGQIARATARPAPADLVQLRQACQHGRLDGAQLYQRFAALGIEYGPSHRGVAEILIGDQRVLARLELAPAQPGFGGKPGIHPGLLDAAFQASFPLTAAAAGGPAAVPFALRDMHIYGPTEERMWAAVAVAGRDAAGQAREFDIDLYGDQGRLCASLRGWCSAPMAALEPAAALDLYRWTWQAREAAASGAAATQIWLAPCFAALAPELAGGAACRVLPVQAAGSAAEAFEDLAAYLLGELRRQLAGTAPAPVRWQLAWPLEQAGQAHGLLGLFKTAALEHPRFSAQLIEAPAALAASELRAMLDGAGSDGLVRYQDGRRLVLRPAPLPPAGPAPQPWMAQGTYALVGGLGGIGRAIAADILAASSQARVVLLGRRPPSPDSAAVLAALDPQGERLRYAQLDAADAGQVSLWTARLVATGERLRGIVHCAGILDDRALLDKQETDFRRVLQSKARALVNLDQATAALPLDFLVCCSSLSGAFGNHGQADYAAANAFLDAYMVQRAARVAAGQAHGLSISVQWPLWEEGGMRMAPALVDAMRARQGLLPLPRQSALEALRQAIALGEPVLMPLYGQRQAMAAWLETAFGVPASAPVAFGREALCREIARLAGVTAAEIDADTALAEYGLDAVALAALARWLAHQPEAGADLAAAVTLQSSAADLLRRAAPDAAAADLGPAQAEQVLRDVLAKALGVPAATLDAHSPFEKFGINSLLVAELNGVLEASFGSLPKTLFFEYQTIGQMAAYFLRRHAARLRQLLGQGAAPALPAAQADVPALVVPSAVPQAAPQAPPRQVAGAAPGERFEVAIVGMAGRYPQAADLDAFWRNLRDGVDSITEIPAERWSLDGFYDPAKAKAGSSYGKWGGFIDGMDEFDPLFFNIAPREAELMDPQERLFLQTAYGAMEHAGYTRATLGGMGEVGVFAGVMYQEYQLHGVQESAQGRPLSIAGSAASVANRVSYHLNLYGPSMSVDTMCSSSLTAIHLACQSLRNGDCQAALAGGVNLSIHPNKYILLSQNRFVSSKGRCESFGEGGDGYVPAEGVGVVLLKPLQRAIADGDQIHGVICGSAINHGGRTHGYTVPHPQRQAAAIARALSVAGVAPQAVSYVEAHGTGTALGDPIEVAGLMQAYGAAPRQTPCALGSVKSNIGHAESAAGVAGLSKILLQFKHGQLAPSLHAQQMNPDLALDPASFVLQRQLAPWPRPQQYREGQVAAGERIAGLSSFGAGGANAHLIVREYLEQGAAGAAGVPAFAPAAWLLSARDEARLRERAAQLLAAIEHGEYAQADVARIAYTLQVGKEGMEQRLAFGAATLDEAQHCLQAFLRREAPPSLHTGKVDARTAAAPADGALSAQLAQQLGAGRLDQVLAAWCAGAAIDWQAFYGADAVLGEQPRRLVLPGYPFARTRYWYAAPAAAQPAPRRFASHWSGGEACLRDHQIGGAPVLPGVAYLHIVSDAWRQARPERPALPLRLERVLWRQPCGIGAEGATLTTTLTDTGTEYEFAVGGADGAVYCSGQVAALEQAAPCIDLDEQRRLCGDAGPAPADCYAFFARHGAAYGPSHRTLERLWTGPERVLARLRGSASGETLDLGLLDGALQAVIALGPLRDAQMEAPFMLASAQLFAPCSQTMWALVTRDAARRVDILLCSEEGEVCVALRGFASRALPGMARQDGATGDLLFAPQWQPCPAAAPAPSPVRLLLAAGATPEQLARLRRDYPQAQLHDCEDGVRAAQLAASLRPDGVLLFAPQPQPDLIACQEQGVLALLQLAKALAQASLTPALTVVTENAAAVSPDETVQPAHAAMLGLAGVLAREHPNWQVRALDVEAGHGWPMDEAFSLPCGAQDGPWAHRAQRWMRRSLGPVHVAAAAPAPYRQHGVYLIVGGAGGVGRELSAHLIRNFQASVVWVGRRELDDTIRQAIEEVAVDGVAPLYFSADAADAAALARVRGAVLERFGALHGVVHSALLLKDQSAAAISAQDFRRVLAAKVDTSVRLAECFGDDGLDFLLFFSSFACFSHVAGQGNYTAGSYFQDAYAHSLASTLKCKVKVINWGYWGHTGIVSTPAHRSHMASLGIGSIGVPAAMAALDALLGAAPSQLALINLQRADALAAFRLAPPRMLDARPQPPAGAALAHGVPAPQALAAARAAGGLQREEWQTVLLGLLRHTLQQLERDGADIVPRHERWLAEALVMLAGHEPVARDAQSLWRDWERAGAACAGRSDLQAQYRLVDTMLRALPAILSGKQQATSVMFPGGGFALVDGVYRDNAVADLFNHSLAALVCARWRELGQGAGLRILEVGAGTGGTTGGVLAALREHAVPLAEYCFTDVSQAFLAQARQRFGEQGLNYRLFDVTRAPQAQGLAPASYDLVLATNVLHATPDIAMALRHCKAVLAAGGLLLINEISDKSLFTHLTFGLLDGWWQYADEALRIPGSPALSAAGWNTVLRMEGFQRIGFPLAAAHNLGQQLIVAQSDGLWPSPGAEAEAPAPALPSAPQPAVVAAAASSAAPAVRAGGAALATLIAQQLARTLKVPADLIGNSETFSDYGMDSINGMEFAEQLQNTLGMTVDITSVFEHSSVDALAAYLAPRLPALPEEPAAQAAPPASAAPSAPAPLASSNDAADGVAIIGLSCQFAGGDGLDALWAALEQGRDCSRVATAQWLRTRDGAPDAGTGQRYRAGFMDGADQFAAEFFRISPMEAAQIDPQQRLLLTHAWRALQDSGVDAAALAAARTGVFVAAGAHEYAEPGQLPPDSPFAMTALAPALVPNRISYCLDLAGPSEYHDTACSSSLVALHRAVQSLQRGECGLAVVGAVNLLLSDARFHGFEQMGFLSRQGRARSFDASADGFVRSEGVAAAVLKPLRQALADGDAIYGVIKGSAVGHGGRGMALTAPHGAGIGAAMRQAYTAAGVDPRTVSYIEAHGVATPVADAIEVHALRDAYQALCADTPSPLAGPARCLIGSAKPVLGHAELASGMLALCKVLLAMRQRVLPGVPGLQTLHSGIALHGTPLAISGADRAWSVLHDTAGRPLPRRASISSFGFGGVNAHLVLEEAPPHAPAAAGARRAPPTLSSRRHWLAAGAAPQAAASVPAAEAESDARVESVVRAAIGAALACDHSLLEADVPLAEYGADSMLDVYLASKLEVEFGVRLAVSDLFRHRTLRALCTHIAAVLRDTPAAAPGAAAAATAAGGNDDGDVGALLLRLRQGEVALADVLNLL
ncbi:SDR family NAD(P)-dependent oxidoreductase [Pseudoduganella violacea]|uniref:Acyl transferase domain-containing protein/acyl carrier protein/SAM-dependent methyltransferase n=1 Tax=Pseudoduganella violacea TaxID=1715466 RepID=A0A7W5BDN3_9BURK|nr:SDR family NAD(P)-dependent oxidoreductase [Pseudoduganella violacea]MBB3120970.1 acyl transferase domain-containing protein/acyl carrier protein/SAM-dependent methyltransferase [Pseudoduganella violacea]